MKKIKDAVMFEEGKNIYISEVGYIPEPIYMKLKYGLSSDIKKRACHILVDNYEIS